MSQAALLFMSLFFEKETEGRYFLSKIELDSAILENIHHLQKKPKKPSDLKNIFGGGGGEGGEFKIQLLRENIILH